MRYQQKTPIVWLNKRIVVLCQPIMQAESFAEFSRDSLCENCILKLGEYASSHLSQVYEIWALEISWFRGTWLHIRLNAWVSCKLGESWQIWLRITTVSVIAVADICECKTKSYQSALELRDANKIKGLTSTSTSVLATWACEHLGWRPHPTCHCVDLLLRYKQFNRGINMW